ncbi:MAG: hypothetical protein OXQ89_11330 [Rhodospirillaceae bacterium]|nr:hypothetical protein [Rhodospirillaceae bacterium]
MGTSGHAWPGVGKEHAADADGVLLERERLADDGGIHDEHLSGCCSRVAALTGALVDLPEIGRIGAVAGPDRCREALSRARNRSF